MYDAGLEARYASLTEKIPHGVKTGYLGAAVVAASLSTRDHTVTEDDVRGGAARPFPTVRETVVARTRGRRPRHRVAQVRDPAVLAGFSVEALQRAYDTRPRSKARAARAVAATVLPPLHSDAPACVETTRAP